MVSEWLVTKGNLKVKHIWLWGGDAPACAGSSLEHQWLALCAEN